MFFSDPALDGDVSVPVNFSACIAQRAVNPELFVPFSVPVRNIPPFQCRNAALARAAPVQFLLVSGFDDRPPFRIYRFIHHFSPILCYNVHAAGLPRLPGICRRPRSTPLFHGDIFLRTGSGISGLRQITRPCFRISGKRTG